MSGCRYGTPNQQGQLVPHRPLAYRQKKTYTKTLTDADVTPEQDSTSRHIFNQIVPLLDVKKKRKRKSQSSN